MTVALNAPAALVLFVLFASISDTIVYGDDANRRPNVVFILTDDHGALDAGCYGSSDLKTPHIDSVAKSGIRFVNAYAHTVCCPARAMMMTGRHPQRGDIGTWAQGATTPQRKGHNLLTSETTVAEAFRDAGYATACFGKWHIGAAETHGPTRQGFDEFFGIRSGFIDNYKHFMLHTNGRHDLFDGTTEVFRDGEYFMEMVTDRAIGWMKAQNERPFFLYFPLNLPHYPEQSIEPFAEDFEEHPEPRRSYARILATTDHYVGRIVEHLKSSGQFDNTVIVITGDNGYSAEDYQIDEVDHPSGIAKGTNYGANAGGGNTGKWRGAKGSFLEGGLRVPAILSYPQSLPSNQTCEAIVTLMDWFPTAADIAGVDVGRIKFDGRSVASLCRRPDGSDGHYDEMNWQWQKGWAARRGDWKLIVRGTLGLSGDGKNAMDNRMPRTFLGSLSDDAPELKNYAEERPDLVHQLTQQHESWAKDTQPNESERWK